MSRSSIIACISLAALWSVSASATTLLQAYSQNQLTQAGVTVQSTDSQSGGLAANAAPVTQLSGTDQSRGAVNVQLDPFGASAKISSEVFVTPGDAVSAINTGTATITLDLFANADGNLFLGGQLNMALIPQDAAYGGAYGLQNGGYYQSVSETFQAYVNGVLQGVSNFSNSSTPDVSNIFVPFGVNAPVKKGDEIVLDATFGATTGINGAYTTNYGSTYGHAFADPPTFSFTASSDTAGLSLLNADGTVGIGTQFVPEPGSLLLMGLGLSGLASVRRRRPRALA